MNYQAVQYIPENKKGRDFVVGDIHGCFHFLKIALDRLDFDPEIDRLFSVGDLFDRGPQSEKALHYLNQPWFFAVKGNHEDLMIRYMENPIRHGANWVYNGGMWFADVSDKKASDFYDRVNELPYALEIDHGQEKIGILHAEIPLSTSWQEFTAALEAGDAKTRNSALWDRYRSRVALDLPVAGIDRIFCGHTVYEQPTRLGNIHFIDTGAVFNILDNDEQFKLTLCYLDGSVATQVSTGDFEVSIDD